MPDIISSLTPRQKKQIFTAIVVLIITSISLISGTESNTKNNQSASVGDIKQEVEIDISKPFKVIRIVDGDTFVVEGDITVRLIGVNTPETVDPRKEVQCFGKEASEYTKRLLTDSTVIFEIDKSQETFDRYGRLLAYVWKISTSSEDRVFVNKDLIENGYAYEYTYSKPYLYQSDFREAQKEAREEGRGLWSKDVCPTT
jgi:micrococcal nuclease